jgi:hypothetical protein
MRKLVPFVLTVLISVVFTASIVQAAGGTDPVVTGTAVAPSSIFGANLAVAACNSSPSNAAQWTKFAGCATRNFTAIRRWATTLDNCMTLLKVESRHDDAYITGNDPALDPTVGDGLAIAPGATGNFNYFMAWKNQAGCPRTP